VHRKHVSDQSDHCCKLIIRCLLCYLPSFRSHTGYDSVACGVFFQRTSMNEFHIVYQSPSLMAWRMCMLNGAVVPQGTFPEPLQPAANSVVCTSAGDTSLLRAVFNKTSHDEHPISFPPSRCRTAISRCQQCIAKAHCRHQRGLFTYYYYYYYYYYCYYYKHLLHTIQRLNSEQTIQCNGELKSGVQPPLI